jgi:hypothetical protein
LGAGELRIAVVGHRIWFENHYPERWRTDPEIRSFDVSERDYSWLMALINYRPDVTLFYRPEIYPKQYIQNVRGIRIAVLSEPLPLLENGRLVPSEETALRMRVYRRMPWEAYHWRIYYDPGKAASAASLGFIIDEFRPMPIDTEVFRPPRGQHSRPFDICFVGKATPHRIAVLDFLRLSPLRFLWVAHGVSGRELAQIFKRSRAVLNIHADGVPALEPRLYLAAACGCQVITEPLSSRPTIFLSRIIEEDRTLNNAVLQSHLKETLGQVWTDEDEAERQSLSARQMIESIYSRLKGRVVT